MVWVLLVLEGKRWEPFWGKLGEKRGGGREGRDAGSGDRDG